MPPALSVTPNPTEVQSILSTLREEQYFEEMIKITPMGIRQNAMMTLFASRGAEKRTEDPLFHFFRQPWNQRDCAAVDVYNGPGLTNATTTSVSGDTRNIAVTATNAKLWQVGQMVVVTKFNEAAYLNVVADVRARITGVTVGSDSTSYITVKLVEADTDSALAGTYIRLNPGGQSHPNIHSLPASSLEQPTKYDGACSTFLGAYEMDDITAKIKYRASFNPMAAAKAKGLKDFLIDKEMAFLESVLDITTTNHLCTGGLNHYLKAQEAENGVTGTNIVNALTTTTYLTASQTGSPDTWLYELLENLLEYRSHWAQIDEIPVFCGGQAMLAVNQMLRDKGVWNIGQSSEKGSYGFKARKLDFQHGTLMFMQHPLFTNASRYAGSIIIPDFDSIKTVVFSPFEEIPADVAQAERQKRAQRDGTTWSSVAKGGYREICGWKFERPDSMFILKNVHPKLART